MNIKLMDSKSLQQAVELSDRIFLKQPEQPSMEISFPLIFDPGFSHSYGAFDDNGNLASFMDLVPFTIRAEAANLKVYSIGSVCTDEDNRGKGLAGELLNQCKAHAERSGASLIFISGGRSLYTRANCRHFGRAMELKLTSKEATQITDNLQQSYLVREMLPEDSFAIHEFMEKRRATYVSTVSELDKLLDASAFANVIRLEQRVLMAEQNGSIVAFVIMGVPGTKMTPSRPPTLIEWGGDAEAAACILAQSISLYDLEELIITLPWQDQELSGLLQSAGCHVDNIQNSGTIYLVNGRELLRQIAPLLPEEAAGVLQAQGDHGPYLYHHSGETITLDDEGLLSLLFDPESHYRKPVTVTDASEERRYSLPVIPLPYTAGLQYI